jgi:hypothetical protein
MSNPFSLGSDATFGDGYPPESDDSPQSVGPPLSLLALALFELFVVIIAFPIASTAAHWLGYFVGSVLVAITIYAYRTIDRTRRRSGLYGTPGGIRWIPKASLIAGVALAAGHAFYLAISRRLA